MPRQGGLASCFSLGSGEGRSGGGVSVLGLYPVSVSLVISVFSRPDESLDTNIGILFNMF